MTDIRLIEACAAAVEKHLEELFDTAPRISGTGLAEIPLVGGRFLLGAPVPSGLYQRVFAALVAGGRFHQDNPTMPDLPLHDGIYTALIDAECPRANVFGYYARSLAAEEWAYELHPRYAAFVAGLLAHPSTPDEIRNDVALQRAYPPRVLDGLCDELYWCSPGTLAMQRDMLARIAAADARRGP
jgi:hypothetical protein